MSFSRRFLPSMSLLCAFEAAARHQSFTAAAAELHLTQSAVSRQVRALEEAVGGLGVALLPRFLIETELARGDLVEPLAAPMESIERYYLAWPIKRAAYPPLQAFRAWLKTVAPAP